MNRRHPAENPLGAGAARSDGPSGLLRPSLPQSPELPMRLHLERAATQGFAAADQHRNTAHPAVSAASTADLPDADSEPLSALQRVLDYMHEHLCETVTVPMLASIAGCSASHLAATFRRSMGESPHRYLVRLRVERARMLLMDGSSPAQAAALAGFYDHSHLSRRMRQVLGMSPAAVKARDAGEPATHEPMSP